MLAIKTEVRNLRNEDVNVTVEWYFLAKTMKSGKRWIFDKGSKDLLLSARKTEVVFAASKTITAEDENYSFSRYKRGSKTDGYIVRVVADGEIIKVNASSKPMEEIARDSEQLAALQVEPKEHSAY